MQAELYEALIEAGTTEPKAKAAAEAITNYRKTDEVAAKADIAELKTDIAKLEGKLEKQIAELETRLTWRMIVIIGVAVGILKFIP